MSEAIVEVRVKSTSCGQLGVRAGLGLGKAVSGNARARMPLRWRTAVISPSRNPTGRVSCISSMNRLSLRPFSSSSVRSDLDGRSAAAALFVRLSVGGVFLISGALKFAFDNQGVGRFTKLGLPAPASLATFVGGVEVVCGALILVGLLTRLAAVPLVIDMLVALVVTKLPLLFGPGPEPVAALPKVGFLAFAYQSRLDLTMLTLSVYLVALGAGAWSVDASRLRRRRERTLIDAVQSASPSDGLEHST
jgi:putative oxidoreductase